MDNLRGCFRHCNWFSLRRLVPWTNHLPPVWLSSLVTFKFRWSMSLTIWKLYFIFSCTFWLCFPNACFFLWFDSAIVPLFHLSTLYLHSPWTWSCHFLNDNVPRYYYLHFGKPTWNTNCSRVMDLTVRKCGLWLICIYYTEPANQLQAKK